MARHSADLPPAPAIRALLDHDRRLRVRVSPGARVASMAIVDGVLAVKVRAKAVDGSATAAVREMIAAGLGLSPSTLELLRGATSRDKVFRLKR